MRISRAVGTLTLLATLVGCQPGGRTSAASTSGTSPAATTGSPTSAATDTSTDAATNTSTDGVASAPTGAATADIASASAPATVAANLSDLTACHYLTSQMAAAAVLSDPQPLQMNDANVCWWDSTAGSFKRVGLTFTVTPDKDKARALLDQAMASTAADQKKLGEGALRKLPSLGDESYMASDHDDHGYTVAVYWLQQGVFADLTVLQYPDASASDLALKLATEVSAKMTAAG